LRGLGADGIVGPHTWPQLIIQVQQGSNGDAVRAVQSQIHGRGDGAHIAVDGIFGPDTNDAVRAFQTLLGLSVDGIVGQQTWNHLVNGYLAAPDPQTAAKDVFNAWEAHNRDQAGKNATPAAVNEIFAGTGGGRTRPWLVHSVNPTWATSSGSVQVRRGARSPRCRRPGDPRLSRRSRAPRSRSRFWSKPVPTLPA
jgi:hypothetical protein